MTHQLDAGEGIDVGLAQQWALARARPRLPEQPGSPVEGQVNLLVLVADGVATPPERATDVHESSVLMLERGKNLHVVPIPRGCEIFNDLKERVDGAHVMSSLKRTQPGFCGPTLLIVLTMSSPRNRFFTDCLTFKVYRRRSCTMSKKAAEHHRKAAEHHEKAAGHHKEAAKHHEAGQHEKAAHHAHTAHGHHEHAAHHASEAAKEHSEQHGSK
jgi:hypothetical protein